MTMRIVLATLALAALPSSLAQTSNCTSLCADGSAPPNTAGILPVPGVGDLDCGVAASLISSASLNSEDCTLAQAAAFLICECPTAPPPNAALSCSFCPNGSPPTNLGATIVPSVSIPSNGGQVDTCEGLVALASVLTGDASDSSLCTDIQTTYAEICGCTLPQGEAATAPPTATPVDGSPVANPAPSTSSAAPSATILVDSSAPSLLTGVSSSMSPSIVFAPDTSMPTVVVDGGSGGSGGEPSSGPGITPFPSAEPTSSAYAAGTVTAMAIGMLVAVM